jgi:dTDP-4-dehydrorhamnose reductase
VEEFISLVLSFKYSRDLLYTSSISSFISASAYSGKPIPSSAYPTPAKRSGYSVMDCSKLVKDYGIELVGWQKSLEGCIKLLGN